MSYRAFCDKCGKETERNYVSDRFEFTVGNQSFQIIVANNGTWNAGVICLKCLRNAMTAQLRKEQLKRPAPLPKEETIEEE